MEQLQHGLIEEVAEVERSNVVAQFAFIKPDILQRKNARLNQITRLKESA